MKHNEKHRLSIFCKEELPTWNEIYNDFFLDLSHTSTYDPSNPDYQELDLYWKIPRKKMLLAIICNQVNKMLFEDNKMNTMNRWISENSLMFNDISFIFFTLSKDMNYDWNKYVSRVQTVPPYIYYCPLPTGEKNIFQISSVPRIDISTISSILSLTLNIVDSGRIKSTVFNDFNYYYKHLFEQFIEYLLADVIEYFEDTIGWKDSHGNNISNKESINKCTGVGIDPAL